MKTKLLVVVLLGLMPFLLGHPAARRISYKVIRPVLRSSDSDQRLIEKIEYRADPNRAWSLTSKYDKTVVDRALEEPTGKLLEGLIRRGLAPNVCTGSTHKYIPLLSYLISRSRSSMPVQVGPSPEECKRCIILLLDHGADPNRFRDVAESPVRRALFTQDQAWRKQLLSLLSKYGARLSAVDSKGVTLAERIFLESPDLLRFAELETAGFSWDCSANPGFNPFRVSAIDPFPALRLDKERFFINRPSCVPLAH